MKMARKSGKILEDEDQRPSKEWGHVGWYRHPAATDIAKVSMGKTVC